MDPFRTLSASAREDVLDILRLLDLSQISELFEWRENPCEPGWPSGLADTCDGIRAERGICCSCCLNQEHKPAEDKASKPYTANLYPHRIRQRGHPCLMSKCGPAD
jgi:hypothetical protein